MKFNSNLLLEELCLITNLNIEAASNFKLLDQETLNHTPEPAAWSILQCIEHLNRYAAYYLPSLDQYLISSSTTKTKIFKSGLIGNHLVNMVLPRNNSRKMKAFATMDTSGSCPDIEVLDTFLDHQTQLLKQMEKAKSKDLNKAVIPVTFTSLFRMRPGDTFRFLVYHNQRHIQQAQRNIS